MYGLQSLCNFLVCAEIRLNSLSDNELSRRSVYKVIARSYSQGSNIEKTKAFGSDEGRDVAKVGKKSDSEWNLELDWFTKTLEPALQMLKRALPAGVFVFCSCCVICFITFFELLSVFGNVFI